MAELAVDRAAQDLHAKLLEGGVPLGEGDDLGRADEGEVERVEEEDDVPAFVVRQGDLLEAAIGHHGVGGEAGGGFLNEYAHVVILRFGCVGVERRCYLRTREAAIPRRPPGGRG